jgi:Motility related/secretion protein
MWLALGLSVHLLINIPGLGNVPLPRFGAKRAQPTAADSLPPTWRHASRLALENHFVDGRLAPLDTGESNLGYTRLQLLADPRSLHIDVDPDSGTVATTAALGDVDLGFEGRRTLSAYSADFMRQNFERRWADLSRKNINSLGDATPQTAQRQGLSFQLPVTMPRGVSNIIGPGGPALNVYGSENIRISGTSNWSNLLLGQGTQKRSLFPTLDMQQDLDIRLEGQLSDRIRVNLLQNSANQIPLSNRIAINYKGDEDALFQSVDLGNTNLTLPGTQYVSYSGKNEGLFGAKASSRLGPLDFTLLASKQEGRSERASYSGGSVKQTQSLRDLEYIRGVYYLLYDPNVEGPYDISEGSLKVYRDDVTASNDVILFRGMALVHPEQLSIATSPVDSSSLGTGPVAARGNFDLLTKGVDYDILTTVYNTTYRVLRLRSSLNGEQRLAVTYQRTPLGPEGQPIGPPEQVGGFKFKDVDGDTSTVMKLLRVGPTVLGSIGSGLDAVFDTTKALYPTRELELRNFYQLPGRNIDKQSLKITIRRGRDDPPVTTVFNPGVGLAVPYIEVLGLDNLDETQNTPQQGHDGRIDGLAVESRQTFVDYENGLLYFLEPRPFAPRLGSNGKPFDRFISSVLFRRDSLTGPPGSSTEPNPAIYDKYNIQTDTDARYFIDVEYSGQSAGGDISLGRGNILEGSDVVTVNGQALQRGRDYDIDYDLGRVTLKRTLGPTDNLNIDYSYAPLFQQAGRTLLGSAFRLEGRNKSFGGAFLYESHGAQDIRPRLGEEPSRSLIGDLNTDWSFQPGWMTRLVDHLPGVRTTAPSELKFQAEVGASLPNPNTRNEVYIDDMEGVRDAVSLTMDAGRWRWSSVPSRPTSVLDGVAIQPRNLIDLADNANSKMRNAEVHWYSPYAIVKERDLKPSLSDAQGAQNNRTVLAISVPRRPLSVNNDPVNFDSLWVGLTYPLDPHGIDLSKSQFLELWVNDFNDHHEPSTERPRIRGRHVRMHIDVGTVSEDQMRSPDVPPDGLLNTEDRNQDGTLDVTSKNEDTGVDGQLDIDEPHPPLDLVTATDQDPHGDDYVQPSKSGYDEDEDARRYQRTNGTEVNKDSYPYPDTEDLDGGGAISRSENYVEYSFDLGDANHPYLATDVRTAYPGFPTVGEDNGWRRYRIPIDDSLRVAFGNPNLAAATQVRVWFDGLTLPDVPADSCNIGAHKLERPLLMLASLDIVGSRWRAGVVDTNDVKVGGSMTLNSVNTLDNAEIYAPPFDPGSTRNGSQELTRREQSIALEFTRFGTGHTIESFRTLSLDEDYSRYGKLNWFVTGYGLKDSLGNSTNEGLTYFVRFSSDELGANYYEYRAPLPNSPGPRNIAWSDVRIGLSELSDIKLLKGSAVSLDTVVARTPGSLDSLAVKGRPSFTRLRRISFGVVNRRGTGFYESGQMWFDELRGIDVQKDRGFAQRVLVSGRFANLLQYNFNWNGRDANFAGVGEQRGSGNTNNSYSFSSQFDLHRFFEATGIILPVTFNFAQNTIQPRFSAGSDVVFGPEDQARSETFSDSRGWAVSYSRAWSDRANPLLRYTIGGVTANYSTQSTHGHSPVTAERTTASSLGINYGIAPRNILALKLPLVAPRLYPFPERFYINYRTDERRSAVLERIPYSDDFVPKSLVAGRAGGINLGADSRPFDFLHHHYEQARNLNLPYYPFTDATRRSLNVGSLVSWMQNMDASYTVRMHPWLSPQLSWNARYNQGNGPELSPDLSVRSIANGQQGTVRMTFPFGDLLRPMGAAAQQRPGVPDTSRRARPQRPALWRNALSRFGNIGADFAVGKSSGYSRLTGSPDFLYLFGLTSNPGLGSAPGDPARMRAQFGNTSNQNFDWHASARTSLVTGFGSTIQALGDYATRTTNTNGAESGDDKLRFPDLQFDYGQVPNVLRIDKLLHNPRLRTSFNRTLTTTYANGRNADKTGSSRGFQFQPLLGLSGDLTNGTRVELSIEHRNTETEILQLGRSLTFDRNTDINFSINRQYSQGQKFTFLGKESTVRSSISMGLTTVFSRQTGGIETILNGIPSTRSPTEKERLSVNTNGSYGFSNNLSARAELGFVQDHNKTSDIINRTVRVELSARFSF